MSTNLTPELIQELSLKLNDEKKRIEDELELLTKKSFDGEQVTKFNEIGSAEDENATEVEEYADNVAIKNSLTEQLFELNKAIEKLKNNTYGKCEKCSSSIATERLLVYPAAKTCAQC